MRREGNGEHLVFAWSPAGYTLDVRLGEPPSPGTAVDDGGRRYRVARVGSSPLPRDPRPCVYLLPTGSELDAPETNGGRPARAREDSREEPADDFQALLAAYPEGACVVAVDAEGQRTVLTINSLVALSLDPPLVGFAVPNDEALQRLLPEAGGCAISLLAGGQQWLADHFAEGARPIAMWYGLAAEPGAAGAPLFVGALGWLECALLDSVVLGSHTFFVCDVRRIEHGHEAPALLRAGGAYGVV